MLKINVFLSLLCCLFLSYSTYSAPWYTGPLLAPSGKTIPRGHIDLETYAFYTENTGRFDRHWKLIESPSSQSIQINPLFSYGLTSNMDLQFSLPYTINRSQGQSGKHIGDVFALLGFQALEQKESAWRPDLRLTIQQIFPTGRFDDLNPTNLGTDVTGVGSYQTTFGLNFQHLNTLFQRYYLRKRLSLTYLYAAPVHIRGHTSYGGNAETNGSISPGNMASIDLAGELSLTQNWVLVMEGFYFKRNASNFTGNPGLNSEGLPLTIGNDIIQEFSLAPAIEYNFSANYGLIAGVWFSVKGKDAPDFMSTIIALNAFW